MKLLPFLLGATLLFWGWQTGFWFAAIPLAIIYEGSHYVDSRWHFSTEDFRQTSHLCTALLVGVLIYLFIGDRSPKLIFSFFQWLPVICAPLLIAQAFSTSSKVDLHALLFFKGQSNQQQFLPVDLTYPYFAICLLAASAANIRELSFYIGIVILINFVLNSIRSPRYSYVVFLFLLLLATALGTVGHVGLHRLQITMEQNTARFFYGFYRPQTNPDKVSTAIGDIGSVKLSNQIVLRVKPEPGQIVPRLLAGATYNRYTSGLWGAAKADFKPVQPGQLEHTWQLQEKSHQAQTQTITVSEKLDDGQGLLKLPSGSFGLTHLLVAEISQSQYGTIQVSGKNNLLSYQVQYDPNLSIDSPPIAADLQIIDSEKPAIAKIITELHLEGKSPQEILTSVNSFFNTKFGYSLKLAQSGNSRTPLAAFLLNHRSGHCEYFATATALLLRSLGIPTRYTVGYSVHEESALEKQYVVRGRHAHAWTQVYIDGKWQIFDTTPSSWIAIEDQSASQWQSIQDLVSLLWFKISQVFVLMQSLGKLNYLWWLSLPLGWVLIKQLNRQGYRKKITVERINQNNFEELSTGTDSEIYLIEQELNKLGIHRDRAETWQTFLARLRANPDTAKFVGNLEAIIPLHYRYCFDPAGITSQERKELSNACQNWLDFNSHSINANYSQSKTESK